MVARDLATEVDIFGRRRGRPLRRAEREASPWGVGRSTIAVLDLVHETPGASHSLIARRLGIDASTVKYHVHRLERAGAVVCAIQGRERRVFPPGAVASVVTADDARVLEAVRAGARRVCDILAATGFANSRARNALMRLRAEGLVVANGIEWRGGRRGVRYEPTAAFAYVRPEEA